EADVADLGAGEDRAPDVDRVRRARHERGVARAEQRPHQGRVALLRPDRRARLRVRVQLDAEPAAVQIRDREAQLPDAAAGGVAHRLAELLDRDIGRWDVGVAEPEVDDVLAGAARVHLELVDRREDIRRESVDAPELHATTVPGGVSGLRYCFGDMPPIEAVL